MWWIVNLAHISMNGVTIYLPGGDTRHYFRYCIVANIQDGNIVEKFVIKIW